jgi:hypothetical protein
MSSPGSSSGVDATATSPPLPLNVAQTSQGGATALFQVHGLIRVTTGGPADATRPWSTTPATNRDIRRSRRTPLDINVNGIYWVVAEQNDCSVGVTQLAPP